MRKGFKIMVAGALALSVAMGAYYAAGGTQSDPIITLSKLRSSYLDTVKQNAQQKSQELGSTVTQAIERQGQQALALLQAKAAGLDVNQVAQMAQQRTGAGTRTVTLKQGDTVTGPLGAGFVLREGSASIIGTELVNITAGGSRQAGNAIAKNIYYLVPEGDGSGIRITSATAKVQLRDGAKTSADATTGAYAPQYKNYADGLNAMGLFKGTDQGYELERQPTRLETLILLIRLLGEEQAALAHSGQHNFTDITGWADANQYIAYAVEKGYTNGVSATEFAPNQQANAATLYTYVLRSLGYSDKAGDFIWNSTDRTKMVELGLLTQAQMENIQRGLFRRDEASFICWQALGGKMKGTETMLVHQLIEKGAVTQQQYDAGKALVG